MSSPELTPADSFRLSVSVGRRILSRWKESRTADRSSCIADHWRVLPAHSRVLKRQKMQKSEQKCRTYPTVFAVDGAPLHAAPLHELLACSCAASAGCLPTHLRQLVTTFERNLQKRLNNFGKRLNNFGKNCKTRVLIRNGSRNVDPVTRTCSMSV